MHSHRLSPYPERFCWIIQLILFHSMIRIRHCLLHKWHDNWQFWPRFRDILLILLGLVFPLICFIFTYVDPLNKEHCMKYFMGMASDNCLIAGGLRNEEHGVFAWFCVSYTLVAMTCSSTKMLGNRHWILEKKNMGCFLHHFGCTFGLDQIWTNMLECSFRAARTKFKILFYLILIVLSLGRDMVWKFCSNFVKNIDCNTARIVPKYCTVFDHHFRI